MKLSLRPNPVCLFCLKPITDFRDARITWRTSRSEGPPFLALVHIGCNHMSLWPRVVSSNLFDVLQDPEDWMRMTRSLIEEKMITRGDAEKELGMIFAPILEGFLIE